MTRRRLVEARKRNQVRPTTTTSRTRRSYDHQLPQSTNLDALRRRRRRQNAKRNRDLRNKKIAQALEELRVRVQAHDNVLLGMMSASPQLFRLDDAAASDDDTSYSSQSDE